MQKKRVNDVGVKKPEQHWCVAKDKYVIHTYFECSMPKRAFGRICTECDETCPFECDYNTQNK